MTIIYYLFIISIFMVIQDVFDGGRGRGRRSQEQEAIQDGERLENEMHEFRSLALHRTGTCKFFFFIINIFFIFIIFFCSFLFIYFLVYSFF